MVDYLIELFRRKQWLFHNHLLSCVFLHLFLDARNVCVCLQALFIPLQSFFLLIWVILFKGKRLHLVFELRFLFLQKEEVLLHLGVSLSHHVNSKLLRMSACGFTNTLVQKQMSTNVNQMGWHLVGNEVHRVGNSDLEIEDLHDSVVHLDQMIV